MAAVRRKWLAGDIRRAGKMFATGRYTVRSLAGVMGVSKSMVHRCLAEYLPGIDLSLAQACRQVLDYNRSVRHLRGGDSTRRRWKGEVLLVS